MKRNAPEQRSLLLAAEPHRLSATVLVILAVYGLVILSASVVTGFWLYGWARTRIVQNAPTPVSSAALPPQRDRAAAPEALVADPAQAAAVAEQHEKPVTPPTPAINILLMGTDARPNEDGPSRTDTLILLTFDPQTGSAGMLSLPRDLWVPIPGLGLTDKINLAYAYGEDRNYAGGGAQLVKDTVSSFIGQPVQYYVRVNFRGFVELIDQIGGVEVDVAKTIHDVEYPTADYGVETFHLEAGRQNLDGETALKYVRTRHVDDDYGRARRQQELLKAVFDKVMNTDMWPTLLARAPQLMYTMRSSISTDMELATALELVNYVRTSSPSEIRQLVLDSRYGEETYSADGAWILLPDRAKVRAALEEFFRPTTTASAASGIALARLQSVRIEVLNGTSQPGVAARTRDLLEASGWQVVAIGDADRKDYDRTLLINYGLPQTLIEEVSADLHLAPSLATLQGLNLNGAVDMRIVVGNDLLPSVR